MDQNVGFWRCDAGKRDNNVSARNQLPHKLCVEDSALIELESRIVMVCAKIVIRKIIRYDLPVLSI